MSGYHDRLQGRVRLVRIHRIRLVTLGALAAVAVFFILAAMASSGASLLPLFIPIPEAVQIGLLMGFVGLLMGMYFQNLELKAAQSDSQRYLLAKMSMGRARNTAAVGFVLAAVLLLPGAPALAGDLFTEPPRAISLANWQTESVLFTSPDPLGISYVRQLDLTVASGMVQVIVQRDNLTVGTVWANATDRVPIPLPVERAIQPADWAVLVRNMDNRPAAVTLGLSKGVWPSLFNFMPFLFLLFGVANLGFWIGLRPIRERTKTAGVYGGGVSPGVEASERLYVEYATNPVRDARPSETVATANLPTPPPPPRTAPPPPPEVLVAAPAVVPRPEARAPPPKVESPQTFLEKGDVLLSIGAPDSALVAFDEALRLDGDFVPALRGKAVCFTRLGNGPAALEAYRKILHVDRKDAMASRAASALLIADRRWREALEVVDDALRVRPNDAAFQELRGDVLTNLGRRAEALQAYETAQTLDPRNENVRQKIEEVRVDVPSLMSRALIASASGNYAHALSLFDDILEVEPSNVNALIGKAVAYRRSQKPSEALNCLDLVLNLQPGNVAALLNRGHILMEEDDLDGALETFDRLVGLSPGDEEAWVGQGDVLVRMGRDADGLQAYAESLKRNPGDEETLTKIKDLEAAREIPADVLQDLYRVKGIGPAKAKALASAGYKKPEDFAAASPEELVKVKGITRKVAQDLVRHFKGRLVEAK